MQQFPNNGFVRLSQIIGNTRDGLHALIPISKSSWWAGVKAGKYPRPVKLGPRTTAWRTEDIEKLIRDLGEKK